MLFKIVKKTRKYMYHYFLLLSQTVQNAFFSYFAKTGKKKILHQKQVFIVFLIIGVTIINRTPTVTGSRAS